MAQSSRSRGGATPLESRGGRGRGRRGGDYEVKKQWTYMENQIQGRRGRKGKGKSERTRSKSNIPECS
jgi:hypothetical protein